MSTNILLGFLVLTMLAYTSVKASMVEFTDISRDPMGLNQAVWYCQSRNKMLHVPTPSDTYVDINMNIWLGAVRSEESRDDWVSVYNSEEAVTGAMAKKWAKYQPDDYRQEESCVFVIAKSAQLNDANCNSVSSQSVPTHAGCVDIVPTLIFTDISQRPMNYKDALRFCEKKNKRLHVPANGDIHDGVMRRLWIGAVRSKQKRERWVSSYDENLDVTDAMKGQWLITEPDDLKKNESCVYTDTKYHQLIDTNCDIVRDIYAGCGESISNNRFDNNRRKPGKLKDASKNGTGESGPGRNTVRIPVKFTDISRSAMSLGDAKWYCQAKNKIIHVPTSNDAYIKDDDRNIWLGAVRSSTARDTWVSIYNNKEILTGTLAKYWAETQPDDYRNEEACVHIIAGRTTLNDAHCMAIARDGLLMHAGCVDIVPNLAFSEISLNPMNYYDAKEYCEARGKQLHVPTIGDIHGGLKHRVWLGAIRSESSRRKWVSSYDDTIDVTEAMKDQWLITQPDDIKNNQSCVYSDTIYNQLVDENCDEVMDLHAGCVEKVLVVQGQMVQDTPRSLVLFSDISPDPMWFGNAVWYCLLRNTMLHIPKPNDIYLKDPKRNIWLGAQRSKTSKNTWTSAFNSTKIVNEALAENWAEGQPDNLGGEESCVHVMAGSTRVNDVKCNTYNHNGFPMYAGCVPMAPTLVFSEISSYPMSYFDAKKYCTVRGKRLHVPNHADQHGKIDHNVWLGAVRSKYSRETWVSSYDETLDVTAQLENKWHVTQPNDYKRDESCLASSHKYSELSDENCYNANKIHAGCVNIPANSVLSPRRRMIGNVDRF